MHARLLAGLSQWLRWHWYDRQVSCARVCQWRDMDGLLLYLCLLGCLQSSVVAWLMQTNGKLSSEHRVVYVGENITLHCHKNKNFAGDVRFKAGNTLVPMEYVTVVNSTYARMVKPATADDPMEITYTCRDNDTLLIGSKTINTEYQPQKVENLTVVWYDRRTAIFSWDLGVDAYKFRPDNQNPINPVTTITASYSEDNVTWIECPAADYLSSNTSCRVDSFRWLQSVAVRVRVHNKRRGDTEDNIFNIDTVTKFEKPKPVQRLRVNATNSMCVRLTWYNDRVQLSTTVKYGCHDSALDREKKVPEDGNDTMICDLHPAYSYRFEVRAVPRRGYPSEPVNMTIKMPDAAPASGPQVSNGSYSRSSCSNGTQELQVYVQPVAEEDQNGEIISYTAVYDADNWPYTDSRSPRDLIYFNKTIPCGSSVDVMLYANTSAGQSPSSHLSIPAAAEVAELSEKVRGLDLMVELQNLTQVIAHWKPPVLPHNYSLFLYYCPQTQCSSDDCKYPLEYVEVDATQGSHVLNAGDTQFENGRYGLAAVDADGRGTNFSFTECVYSVNDHNPTPSPPIVIREVGSIAVRWQAKRCDGQRVVSGYVLRKCPSDHMHDCNDVHVEAREESYYTHQFEDVRDDTLYSFQLAANTTSSSGLTEFSAPAYGKPFPPSGWTLGEIAGIAVGGFLIMLLIVCLVYCQIRRYCKKPQTLREMDMVKHLKMPRRRPRTRTISHGHPPVLPERNPNLNSSVDIHTSIAEPQVSSDSGKGTTPPPSPEAGENSKEAGYGVSINGKDNTDYVNLTPEGSGPYAAPSKVEVSHRVSSAERGVCSYVLSTVNKTSTLQSGYVASDKVQEATRRNTATDRSQMSVAPPGPEREHTSLEYSGDTEASCLQKINMTVVSEDPTNTKNDTNSKDVGEKTLEKGVGNEGVIHSAVSAASSPHNQQGTAAHNVETSLQQDEETTDPSTNLTATVLVSDTTGREDEALGKEAGDEYRIQSAGPVPTQHNTGERRFIPAQVDLNFLLGQLVGGNREQLEQGSVESEGSLAVDCPEIPESGSPADCQEIPTPGSPANCPEIPTPGSPADCPEIPTPAFLSDCPEIPTPAFLSDCPEIPTSGSPAEIPVLESTTEVSHPPRQTGYIEKHHADGDSAMKIENAESSMSPTHIPATGTYPATRLTHKPEEVGVVNDEKIEIDNLCEKNAFLKNGKVKRLDSGYDDDCGDNGGKFWSGRWSPMRKPLPENGEEGNLMLDLVAESRSHAPGYVVIPMKQITPSV